MAAQHWKMSASCARSWGDRAKVKAAGGIRTLAQAMAMVEAGADRIGTSSMLTIARELEAKAHA